MTLCGSFCPGLPGRPCGASAYRRRAAVVRRRRAGAFRAVVFRAVVFRAVVFRAVVFRAVVFRAVVVRFRVAVVRRAAVDLLRAGMFSSFQLFPSEASSTCWCCNAWGHAPHNTHALRASARAPAVLATVAGAAADHDPTAVRARRRVGLTVQPRDAGLHHVRCTLAVTVAIVSV